MSHKTHPKLFRIRGIEDFNARGFYGRKMPQYLREDFLIKDMLRKKLSQGLVANIVIDRSVNKLHVSIETAKPGFIIGRSGEGVEYLKKLIEGNLAKTTRKDNLSGKEKIKRDIKIEIKEIKNPWTSAALVAQMAAQQIEKRMPFRQVLKKSMERVMQNKEIKGVKMEVSGRLNGIEISRKEWLKQGRMPLGTLRADIDYAQTEAFCSYGAIGVKVWIYKGDKFD